MNDHKTPLHHVTPDTDTTSTLYHSFLFFDVEKNMYAPIHDTYAHVFKQLNQIVRFK